MPVGPIGSVWHDDTWSDTTWEIGTWGDAIDAVIPPDMTRVRGLIVTPASLARSVRVSPASSGVQPKVT